MEIGGILREHRTIKKLSLRDLSALSNVSISQLSKIERGSHIPSSKTISKIANALDINEKELLIKRSIINNNDESKLNYLRYKVFIRDNFTCQLCGAKSPSTSIELDFIVPTEYGGRKIMENMITICEDCFSGRNEDIRVNGLENDFLYSKIKE